VPPHTQGETDALEGDLSLTVTVNGERQAVPGGCTVRQLLGLLDLDGRRIAVAVNRDVVPRSSFETQQLANGDRIEILEAVGGG
jgi:sulfur carrier protein